MGKTKKKYRKEKNKMGAILKAKTETTETKTKEKQGQKEQNKKQPENSGQNKDKIQSSAGGFVAAANSGTFDPLDRYLLHSFDPV